MREVRCFVGKLYDWAATVFIYCLARTKELPVGKMVLSGDTAVASEAEASVGPFD